jgi:hypothetical protein
MDQVSVLRSENEHSPFRTLTRLGHLKDDRAVYSYSIINNIHYCTIYLCVVAPPVPATGKLLAKIRS